MAVRRWVPDTSGSVPLVLAWILLGAKTPKSEYSYVGGESFLLKLQSFSLNPEEFRAEADIGSVGAESNLL